MPDAYRNIINGNTGQLDAVEGEVQSSVGASSQSLTNGWNAQDSYGKHGVFEAESMAFLNDLT